jgi:hypothetical protein
MHCASWIDAVWERKHQTVAGRGRDSPLRQLAEWYDSANISFWKIFTLVLTQKLLKGHLFDEKKVTCRHI